MHVTLALPNHAGPARDGRGATASLAGLRGGMTMIVALLLGLGVLMIYSATLSLRSAEAEQAFLRRQGTAFVVALGACFLAASMPREFWRRWAIPLFIGTLVLLAAVLMPGVGQRVRGAQRWMRWQSFSLQPSELAKITLVLLLARLGTATELKEAGTWRRLAILLPGPALVAALVVVQPDFGTAMFLMLLSVLVIYLSGCPLYALLMLALAALPAAGWLLIQEPYRLQRLTGYVQAWNDPGQAPYQVHQSLITLGSGGISGKGIGKGWQKLSYLPEAGNDFVFAVIGEELGLLGTMTVVALWCALLVVGLRLATAAVCDPFARLVTSALVISLVVQAAVNIGVVTALLPAKGIPLPLVSYGGSSLLASLLAVGIVFSVTKPVRESAAERIQLRTASLGAP